MRKVLCLSLCSLPMSEVGMQGAERSLLQAASPSRRVRQASFLRPTASAIRLATILLMRFGQRDPALAFLPGQETDRHNLVGAWRRTYTSRDALASTPLAQWADAIPVKFDSVWELLSHEPNGELDSEQPWRSPTAEFWMGPARSRSFATTTSPSKGREAWLESSEEKHYQPTEGAWRTLGALAQLCQWENARNTLFCTLHGKDEMRTLVKLLFSFPWQAPTEDEDESRNDRGALQERAETSAIVYGAVRCLAYPARCLFCSKCDARSRAPIYHGILFQHAQPDSLGNFMRSTLLR